MISDFYKMKIFFPDRLKQKEIVCSVNLDYGYVPSDNMTPDDVQKLKELKKAEPAAGWTRDKYQREMKTPTPQWFTGSRSVEDKIKETREIMVYSCHKAVGLPKIDSHTKPAPGLSDPIAENITESMILQQKYRDELRIIFQPVLHEYHVDIGILLKQFCEIGFDDEESFEEFVARWGLSGFFPYSKILTNIFSQAVCYEELPKIILSEILGYCTKEEMSALKQTVDNFKRDLAYFGMEAYRRHGEILYFVMLKAVLREVGTPMMKLQGKLKTIETLCLSPKSHPDWGMSPSARYSKAMELGLIPELDTTAGGIADILHRELMYIINNSRLCHNCGDRFIPVKRSDEKFCNKIIKTRPDGSYVTCKDIGPGKKREKGLSPLQEAHRRIYKTINSWVRLGKITKDQYEHWKENIADRLLEEALADGTTPKDFEKILKNSAEEMKGNGIH